jgi:predicted amidohydrolase
MITVGDAKVGLTTCYDVRFPGLYLRLAELGAQVICVAASWGAGVGKIEQWQLLTRARALDSTSYVIAAGQADPAAAGPGSRAAVLRRNEGTRIEQSNSERIEQSNTAVDDSAPTGVGYSMAVSPRGEVLESLDAAPGLLVADLDLDVVEQARAAIPVLANRRF